MRCEHGASVHCVTRELDAGPLLAQVRVPIHSDDNAETLAGRVLEREHPLLVETLRAIADGRLEIHAGQPLWNGHRLLAPLTLNRIDQFEETPA